MRSASLPRPLASDDAIRVLVVDDSPLDAGLALLALRRAGHDVESVTAENADQLRAALDTFVPDIVLCDFSFPNFDGFEAQRMVREIYPTCPLIFVSGAISEESAAKALQSGAVDYVMKSSLVRLPIAVERAVGVAKTSAALGRRAHAHVQRLEALWRIANDPEMHGIERSRAMLRRAALDLCDSRPFRAYLCAADAPHGIVLESPFDEVAETRPRRDDDAHRALGDPAYREGARTRSWTDVARAEFAPPALTEAGWGAVITTHFEANGTAYWLTLASPESADAPFGDDDFAYVHVVATALSNHLHVDALEASLRDEEERARQHAQRLEALWKIANDANLRDAEAWLAMLSQAASSIRPGQAYRGVLWRIEGDVMTVEAVGTSTEHALASESVYVGADFAVGATPVSTVLAAGGGTRSWNDVRVTAENFDLVRAQGVHSLIVSTFVTGGATWALTFASGHVATNPLGNLEHAYIEVLASFFANHVQQRWQVEQIRYQRSHDGLTGLLSRAEFRARAIERTADTARYAIIILDISAFHEVNETFGHTIGDAVLVEAASALVARAKPGEIVGRIAGDVFAIHVPEPSSREHIVARARHFAEIFEGSFSVEGREGRVCVKRSASVGFSISPEDAPTVDGILSSADAALTFAKARGHGSIVAYEVGMERDAQSRATLLNEIAEAVATDQFTLFFQPHVEIASGIVSGCEALIRWNHPTRGLVPPMHFIPFAERAGVIASIDNWVMRNAFAAAKILGESRPDFRLYFNLSGRQAGDPSIVRAFVDAARSGVTLSNIGVEITETDAMRDVAATHRVLRALRRLDVRIAIDDFGTGYSSLSSLKQLSVDVVKIDRSFISGVTTDADDRAIAKTIISIADHFGFESLGEGAETNDEVAWLADNGCRYVQGYAISYPLPLEDFRAWLVAYEARSPEAKSAEAIETLGVGNVERRNPENVALALASPTRYWELGKLAAEELEVLPFGAIVVDLEGTVKSYNRYEAALSRLDPALVIGRNFFRDVAPCTAVRAFEGRLAEFTASQSRVCEPFNYYFPFAHGTIDVTITFVRLSPDTILIAVERIKHAKARTRRR